MSVRGFTEPSARSGDRAVRRRRRAVRRRRLRGRQGAGCGRGRTWSGPPLVVAAAAFAVLAGLLGFGARRGVLVGGIVVELVVLAAYVAVASTREPSFEGWGLSIKAVQIVLLVILLRLAFPSRALRGGLS